MVIRDAGRSQIQNEAKSLFTEEVLTGLIDWYRYTLQGEWRYIVFADRRSYMLALIMEIITGDEMRVDSGDFLTDAALFLRCEEMADEYRKCGRFPKILLCDDVMIHGRNMNHIIEGLRDRLFDILADEFDRNEIDSALVKAIDIHVYTRTEDSLLLLGPYIWKLHYMRREELAFLHQLSSDCSSMILRSNITNACYIYTEYLSDQQMERIENSLRKTFVRTSYQNVNQYVKLFYFGSSDRIKAVLSLRVIKNVSCDGYRVAPFAFLPNLDAGETEVLFHRILQKLPRKYGEVFGYWKNVKCKRTFNEMVTLLLSDVILKVFNKSFKIEPDEYDKERELVKLTRNYNQFGFEWTKEMLRELLDGDSVLSNIDITEIVNTAISDDRTVLNLAADREKALVPDEKCKIRQRVEDYFYEQGRIDEQAAHELLIRPYFQTKLRSKRRARGSCFTLADLNQGYSRKESMYCVAFFLQMIDAGVGGLNSYAPNDLEVVGYAQFVKAGEQSLLIKPLQLYEYIPMLSRMQRECGRRLRILTNEIMEFGAAMGWDQDLVDKLVEFIDVLSSMGHTPRDWNGNYIDKVDKKEKENENEKEKFRIIVKQNLLRREYVNYAKDKYGYK